MSQPSVPFPAARDICDGPDEDIRDAAGATMVAQQTIAIMIERFGRATAEHYGSHADLSKIAGHRVNPDYRDQNLRQQAGFSAEVKQVARQNAESIAARDGRRIIRTDDLGHVNHPVADIVAVDPHTGAPQLNPDGTFADGAQMKVHKDLKKYRQLYGENFEKYRSVDLVLPPDQFDAVMADWDAQVKSLEKQRDKLAGNGNAEVAAQKQQQIDAIEDARRRARKSDVTTADAMEARTAPTTSVARDVLDLSHRAGLEAAAQGTMIGGTFSVVRNTYQVVRADKDIREAAADVAIDTGKAALGAYAVGASSTALAGAMQNAGNQLVRNMGRSNAPAVIVQSAAMLATAFYRMLDDDLPPSEFAAHVSREGVLLATSMTGSNLGAMVGTLVMPGVGTLVGGLVGGMVATMLSGSLYAELQRSARSVALSELKRQQTAAMCSALIAQHRQYRADMNAMFDTWFAESRERIGAGFQSMSDALVAGRSIHDGLGQVASAMGLTLRFADSDAFGEHLRSGRPLVI